MDSNCIHSTVSIWEQAAYRGVFTNSPQYCILAGVKGDYHGMDSSLPSKDSTIRVFFEPKSVAVVGASRTAGKLGNTILKNLLINTPTEGVSEEGDG